MSDYTESETATKLKLLLFEYATDFAEGIKGLTEHYVYYNDKKEHFWKVLMAILRPAMKERGIDISLTNECTFGEILETLYSRTLVKEDETEIKDFS